MSQARKTAIIELEMVDAIISFINPVKQASGISTIPAFKSLEEHILENTGRRKHKVPYGFNK
jgi:hypothetical protein